MKKYQDKVILIIDSEGKEISVNSSIEDAKHISAYKRLVKNLKTENFNIMKYLSSVKNIGSLTGFDISKNIGADGNIVFFHTDVHNSFKNVNVASVIIPEDMTSNQKTKLTKLFESLKKEEFELYVGTAERKKGKVIYKRIKYNR